ncbi:MAG: rhamnulokinase family protein [Candidatus Latescibacteria bacterium]|nr:rhamnulokinase family protein [Candidatus Latescibacterota bacterium]
MPATTNYLAYDLGASSGRAVIGRFDGARLEIEEIHRFPNNGIPIGNNYYWDALRLFDEMRTGLRLAVRSGQTLNGLGCDTWGVDYGLLDAQDNLLNNPYCYRDPRTQGMLDEAFKRIPREEIFDQTGIQFMELNTLYQLLAQRLAHSPQLDLAHTFLTMPDLFNFWFTGNKTCEYSNATTTQFYNPQKNAWATDMLKTLDIPTDMLPEVVSPGTVLGPIRKSIADDIGISAIDVIAPACHDTGSAVASVPLSSPDAVYISCGTWALMGTELPEPAINEKALLHNFTNEGGVNNTIRFLKNISGLWIVQECRRIWEQSGKSYDWEKLMALAMEANALTSFIDPDHPDFGTPGDMPTRIRDFCKKTSQPIPDTEGEIIRTALESLALKCRYVLNQLEDALDKTLGDIHIVGGGIHNTLLCQFIASATGRTVLAGPAEATAMGNLLMQAMAKGQIGSLNELRDVVRASTEIKTYEPVNTSAWNGAFEKFQKLI